MRKNCGIIVENGHVAFIKTFVDTLFMKAFAEEVAEDSADDKGGEDDKSSRSVTINYEDLIAKARKEEKDKQYKNIEKLKGQISTLTEQHNADLLTIAELKESASKKGDSSEVTTLRAENESLKKEISELKEQVANAKPVDRAEVERQVRAELEAEYEVKSYRATRIAEKGDEILLPEYVVGDTKEEIDASIEKAIERSNEIKKKLGVTGGQKKKTSKTSAGNPSVGGVQDNTVDLERLATMDVRSKEYADLRKQLGLR